MRWLGIKKLGILGGMCLSFLIPHTVKAESSPICATQLEREITAVTQQPEFERSRWGILVQTLDSQEIVYNLDAEYYFLPASTLKLLTTAAALWELGPGFRIYTPIYSVGDAPHLSSLRIVGRGDPSLTSQNLQQFTQDLQARGVESIAKLYVEDSYFGQENINPTWEWSDLYFYYAPVVNSLILNENTVKLKITTSPLEQPLDLQWSDPIAARQWRISNQTLTREISGESRVKFQRQLGSRFLSIGGELTPDTSEQVFGLAILDPSRYFFDSVYRLLLLAGITIDERFFLSQSLPIQPQESLLTSWVSPPLTEIIGKINQQSNNLYAEALGKILLQESGKTVEEVLREMGVNSDSYQLVDASGLSRHNLVTPEAIVETLTLIDQSPLAKAYQDSLASGGAEETTLSRRLTELSVQGKTGYLTGVATLAGYLYPSDYPPLAFSIFLNQSQASPRQMQEAIDEIVVILSRLTDCSF